MEELTLNPRPGAQRKLREEDYRQKITLPKILEIATSIIMLNT